MKRVILIIIALFSLTLLSVKSKNKKKEFNTNYSYIPSGTLKHQGKNVSIASFYMAAGEVTNGQYREFIAYLKSNGKIEEYAIALPDTAQWKKHFEYNTTFTNLYFWHPAYENYPIVNISKEGAELYCKWLTQKVKLLYPKKTFSHFRLPQKEEWIYAAKGGLKNSPYPWGGGYVRNANGDLLANFMHIGEQNIKKDSLGDLVIANSSEFIYGSIDDYGSDILAPIKSYWPNGYGLYNMAGNVAELIAKDTLAMGGSWYSPGFDIQVTSEENFVDSNPMTGFRVVSTFIER